ncbi:MAG TPA: hypothetical protein VF701_16910 [Thermoanaerobaculia bacterium]
MKRLALPLLFVLASCAHQPPASLDALATTYVKLNLALGEHDKDWVDAYYGPPEWRDQAKQEAKSVAAIHTEAMRLREQLSAFPIPADRMLALRRNYLIEQLGALITKAEMLQGTRYSFDEEARRLYGVTPPRLSDEFFKSALRNLDRELAGDGPLAERLEEYRSRFYIPSDKVDAVMQAALKECRARTLQEIELPAGENFTLEYVKNQPWSGYNWYQGNYQSLIQINTDLPMAIQRALDLACHEGYPGHHTYNVQLEKNLVRDRGWVENSIYPLNSPQSLIAEGTGNYGLRIAFPGDERMKFDRDVLFPIAGLDPAEAERYHRVLGLMTALSYGSNEAARRWIDGEITREQAIDWFAEHTLSTRQASEQRMKFIERYRSYVINYNVGLDLVTAHIESHEGRAAQWQAFRELISSPMLPSNLRK